jgi:DnaK suppressor protein
MRSPPPTATNGSLDAYSQPMASTNFQRARAALLSERHRLLDEIGEAIEVPDQMTYGSQAAAASQVFEQQRDLALRDRSTQQLAAVNLALARLDGGTYGTCIRCGRAIAPERLEALPWAAHCIDCQTIVDRGGR